ncbi:MAG: hypothetical protein IPL71_07880 [Anaerolineales bacterium]|uniref:hypothetical protein n=1 Tax=Candidatus Villigracilis proximus TaxID=3140683 RepID=UPI003135D9BB|nr:hypothetical protein [Anaerolineales bacterium]
MNISLHKKIRRNSIGIAILIIIVIFGLLILIPTYALRAIFAIMAFTFATVLPIRQKKFPLLSLIFIVIGILFILSGAIGDAAENHTISSSVSSQIEFSKILRPWQVSAGLSNTGIGLCKCCTCLVLVKIPQNEPSHSKIISWLPLVIVYSWDFVYNSWGVFNFERLAGCNQVDYHYERQCRA